MVCCCYCCRCVIYFTSRVNHQLPPPPPLPPPTSLSSSSPSADPPPLSSLRFPLPSNPIYTLFPSHFFFFSQCFLCRVAWPGPSVLFCVESTVWFFVSLVKLEPLGRRFSPFPCNCRSLYSSCMCQTLSWNERHFHQCNLNSRVNRRQRTSATNCGFNSYHHPFEYHLISRSPPLSLHHSQSIVP